MVAKLVEEFNQTGSRMLSLSWRGLDIVHHLQLVTVHHLELLVLVLLKAEFALHNEKKRSKGM